MIVDQKQFDNFLNIMPDLKEDEVSFVICILIKFEGIVI